MGLSLQRTERKSHRGEISWIINFVYQPIAALGCSYSRATNIDLTHLNRHLDSSKGSDDVEKTENWHKSKRLLCNELRSFQRKATCLSAILSFTTLVKFSSFQFWTSPKTSNSTPRLWWVTGSTSTEDAQDYPSWGFFSFFFKLQLIKNVFVILYSVCSLTQQDVSCSPFMLCWMSWGL